LDDDDFLEQTRRLGREGRQFFTEAFQEMELPFVPTAGNFILVETGNGPETARQLQNRGIIVRPVAPYGLPDHLRITFGTMNENRLLTNALRDILSK